MYTCEKVMFGDYCVLQQGFPHLHAQINNFNVQKLFYSKRSLPNLNIWGFIFDAESLKG